MIRPRKRKRKGKFKELGGEISQVLGELGLDGAQRAFSIAERWEEAVGPEVARHSRPVAMRGDILEVVVDSSVWAQQLQLQRPNLLGALARTLSEGQTPPSDLRFRVSGQPETAGRGPRTGRAGPAAR